MSTIRKNIVANFTGSAWSALITLLFVPFYLNLMGVESFALVGVFTAVTGLLAFLDLGLSQSMNREMARLIADNPKTARLADTARTLEVVYWGLAVCVMALIIFLAEFIAYQWLNYEELSPRSLQQAIWIMALVIGLRWPTAIYMGGLNGLQRQVLVNVLVAVFATLQGVGALAVLLFVAPTIHVFFMWQALVALLEMAVFRIALRSNLPRHNKGVFRIAILKEIWRFAAGMSGITLLATILTQLDKILLSKLLPLSDFGYYVLAATLAAIIFKIVGPVFTAYYPRLTELVAKNDLLSLVRTYHQGCQVMAVAVLPAAMVLAVFSEDILELWSHNPDIVKHSSLLFSLLIIGNMWNGLMHIPYALQLAHGWTKLALYQNIFAVIVLVPAIYLATLEWGAIGAAVAWISLNCGYILLSIPVMHRRLLKTEKLQWYLNDVGKILLAATAVAIGARYLAGDGLTDLARLLTIVLTFVLTVIVSFISSESLRPQLLLAQRWRRSE